MLVAKLHHSLCETEQYFMLKSLKKVFYNIIIYL